VLVLIILGAVSIAFWGCYDTPGPKLEFSEGSGETWEKIG
jgi:hypothetical protein